MCIIFSKNCTEIIFLDKNYYFSPNIIFKSNMSTMKNIKFLFLLLFAAAIVTTSCKKDDGDGGGDDLDCSTVTFSDDIAPIVESSCAIAGCHAAGFIFGDYTTYEGLEDFAKDGTMETAVITDKTMPKTGQLTQDELDKFKCWLDAGAPNN